MLATQKESKREREDGGVGGGGDSGGEVAGVRAEAVVVGGWGGEGQRLQKSRGGKSQSRQNVC